jgi:hypothetical protein
MSHPLETVSPMPPMKAMAPNKYAMNIMAIPQNSVENLHFALLKDHE